MPTTNTTAASPSLLEEKVQELLGMVRCSDSDFVVWNESMMKKLEGIHAIAQQLAKATH